MCVCMHDFIPSAVSAGDWGTVACFPFVFKCEAEMKGSVLEQMQSGDLILVGDEPRIHPALRGGIVSEGK